MQSKKYYDQEMIWASQLSYLDFTNDEIRDWRDKHNNTYPTVRDLLLARVSSEMLDENSELRKEIYKIHYMGELTANGTGEDIDDTRRFIDRLIGVDSTDDSTYDFSNVWDFNLGAVEKTDSNGTIQYVLPCADWIVYDVKDSNDGTGLFAITFLTDEEAGDAIVSYRGSEHHVGGTMNSVENIKRMADDWINADGFLAKGFLTEQQVEGRDYLNEIIQDAAIQTIATTGHSLGGNLAVSSAIVSGSGSSKFVQCTVFDAPGEKEEFLEYYQDEINAVKDKIYHYC